MHKFMQLYVFLIVAVILSACDSSAPEPETLRKQIVTFAAPEDTKIIYQPFIEKFNQQNLEFSVRFVSLPPPNGTPAEILSATVHAADTAMIENLGRDEIERKYLTDLAPFIQVDTSFDRNDFLPGRLEVFAKNGQFYLVPENLQVPLLFYNTALWQEAGLPQPDKDLQWSDLIEAARTLSKKQGANIERYGLFDAQAGQFPFLAELHERNVQPFDHDPQDLDLTNPAYTEALEQVKRDTDSGAIYIQTAEAPDYISLIVNQKIAIWPTNMTGSTVLPFDVGVLRMPAVPLPFSSATSTTFRGYVMSSGTKQPEQAWRWLSFLSRQTIPLPSGGSPSESAMPVRTSVLQSSTFLSSLRRDQQELVKSIVQQPLSSIPVALYSQDVDYALGVATYAALILREPVEQAFETARARLDEQLAISAQQQPPSPVSIVVATAEPEYDEKVTTIINVAAGAYETEQFRQLVRSFQAETPEIKINLVKDSYNPFSLQQSGEVGAIDCFVNLAYPELADKAVLKDIQPLADVDGSFTINDYPSALIKPYRQGSALLGLPLATYYRTLSYNKSLFEEQGIEPPSQQWTMETLLQTAEAVKKSDTSDTIYGFVGVSPQDLFFFFDRFQVAPVKTAEGKTTVDYTAPAFQDAVKYYVELLKASPHQRFNPVEPVDIEQSNVIAEGRVAMWLGSGGITGMPNLPFETSSVAPLFGSVGVGRDDVRSIGMYISATSSQPEACWKLVRHVSDEWIGIPGTFPARVSQLDLPEYTSRTSPEEVRVAKEYHAALGEQVSTDSMPRVAWQSNVDFFWLYQAIDRALQGRNLTQELQQAQVFTERYVECVQNGTAPSTCTTTVDPSRLGEQSEVSQ